MDAQIQPGPILLDVLFLGGVVRLDLKVWQIPCAAQFQRTNMIKGHAVRVRPAVIFLSGHCFETGTPARAKA